MQMTTGQAGDVARWRDALNPPIYLVSVLPGLGVPLLAGGDRIAVAALLLATFAVVLLQHAINLFNDAADWRLGADVDKRDSWVRVHDGRTRPVVLHAIVSLVTGGLLGLYVLWQQDRWWILPASTRCRTDVSSWVWAQVGTRPNTSPMALPSPPWASASIGSRSNWP